MDCLLNGKKENLKHEGPDRKLLSQAVSLPAWTHIRLLSKFIFRSYTHLHSWSLGLGGLRCSGKRAPLRWAYRHHSRGGRGREHGLLVACWGTETQNRRGMK